jgi:hypothetical protein
MIVAAIVKLMMRLRIEGPWIVTGNLAAKINRLTPAKKL